MAFCKMVDTVYSAIPLGWLRDLLIRKHMESCPRCQGRLASRAEVKRLFVAPEEVGTTEDLWRRVSARALAADAAARRRSAPAGAAWRWAAAAAAAAVIAVSGFWLLREVQRPGFETAAVRPADRFEIEYVNVGGAPAQAFVYQPQGSDTVFVWAARNP
jgi:hypothetical protein